MATKTDSRETTWTRISNSSAETIIKASKQDVLYSLHTDTESTATASKIEIWHKRYLNEKDLGMHTSKEMVQGIRMKPGKKMPVCEICIQGK